MTIVEQNKINNEKKKLASTIRFFSPQVLA